MCIPDTINELGMAEAFRFYRDVLKLHVYPVDGTWSKRSAPGKKPTVGAWWDYDPNDCDPERFFNGSKCHNIGFAPKNHVIVIDLDSKPDKGESVRRFLVEHPDCIRGPYHETNGGAHLLFRCSDLPQMSKPDGRPFLETLKARVCEGLDAELFHSAHSNGVLPPSLHLQGFVYRWKTFGEIQTVSWQWLQETFGFVLPVFKRKGRSTKKKEIPWHVKFKGDLSTLEVTAMLQTLGHAPELVGAEDNKYAILCPWDADHSVHGKGDGNSTVVWQNPDTSPGFKCLHAHCNEKGTQQLLEWAESKEPGIVDRFCKRSRIYEPRQQEDDRPRILHPNDRLDSEVHTELGKIIGPKHSWFQRTGGIVLLNAVPSGFVYSDNPDAQYAVSVHTIGFRELSAQEARTSVEEHCVPGILVKDEMGELEFIKKSFSSDFCGGLVNSSFLRRKLPHILRILTVPTPLKVNGKLVFPNKGYDPRFGTFLIDHAPAIKEMTLQRALEVFHNLYFDFCFTNDQSRTHALARLLTPFARGILGWTIRVPLWFFSANRPGAGKDYLAAITLLVYEGQAFEDMPLGKESEETCKRIIAAARSGRRFMHFSNCQFHLQDQYLTQAITNEIIGGRSLGTNNASSDLCLPNEMEFSLSGNVGMTYREDFENRMRKIELAYFEEDFNDRTFKNPFLHQTVREHRSLILSAANAVFQNWAKHGFPKGPTSFKSFPHWSDAVGGAMVAAGLGDPCLAFKGEYDNVGGDRETLAMTELFPVCRADFGDRWVLKKEIYKCIHAAMAQEEDNDALAYFGQLENSEDARKNQTRLGVKLSKFKGRELGGMKLQADAALANVVNHKYRFVEARPPNAPSRRVDPVDLVDVQGAILGARNVINKKNDSEKNTNNNKTYSSSDGVNVHKAPSSTGREDHLADLSSPSLAVDIETYTDVPTSKRGKILRYTNALNPRKSEIRILSIADPSGGITLWDTRDRPLAAEEREIFESRSLVIHNASFELRFLGAKFGIIPENVFCTLTAAWLLSPRRERVHDLGSVLSRHLKVEIPKGLGASDWGGLVLTEEQIEYAKNDVRYLHRLKEQLLEELKDMKLTHVFEMESKLLPIIAKMETHGFAIDTRLMRTFKEDADRSAADFASLLRKEFGDERLNPASTQELLEAFKKEGIEIKDTSEETLRALSDPRAETILLWRAQTKLSSNVKTLLEAEHEGRIYATFNPLGTVTGRFSSRRPNLQNVTRGELRSCFVPSGPDRRLIIADYSQIELRVAALIAGETVMLKAFKRGEDLHTAIAAVNLGKEPKDVSKAERSTVGKSTNFGFIYGQSAKGFSVYARTTYGLTLTQAQAERFRENFFNMYPALRGWHGECRRKAEAPENNSAHTILGRLLLAQKDDPWARFNLFTEYVVSGSCADLIKVAMLKVASTMPRDVQLVATVHNELVLDAPAEMAEQYCNMTRHAMEEAFVGMFGDAVPVEVEAKVCTNWAEK